MAKEGKVAKMGMISHPAWDGMNRDGMSPMIADPKEIIAHVGKYGVYMVPQTLRNSVLGGMEIRLNKKTADNVIKIGCRGLGTIMALRYYCLLLQELGIDYLFLRKELCCLAPALDNALAQGQDRQPIDEMSRKFFGWNDDEARKLGAKNMVFFCPACYRRGKWLLGDKWLLSGSVHLNHLYCLDLLTPPEVWEGKRLHLDKRIAYFAGVKGAHKKIYSSDPGILAPWDDYRKLLNRIEGLTIVDIPAFIVDVPFALDPTHGHDYFDYVWGWVDKYQLEYLVINHIREYGGFSRQAIKRPRPTKVLFFPELLLEALGKPQR